MKRLATELADLSIWGLSRAMALCDKAIFEIVKWRTKDEEFDFGQVPSLDEPEAAGMTSMTMREIDLGDCHIMCPSCETPTCSLLVGLSLNQDTSSEDFEIHTFGMIAYPCSHVVYSACLTDKIAAILNATETHSLTLSMLDQMATCTEHGVLYTEE